MEKISDIFGSMVFNDAVMRERLPKETYRQVQATMEKGKRLDDDAARIVANAMKTGQSKRAPRTSRTGSSR